MWRHLESKSGRAEAETFYGDHKTRNGSHCNGRIATNTPVQSIKILWMEQLYKILPSHLIISEQTNIIAKKPKKQPSWNVLEWHFFFLLCFCLGIPHNCMTLLPSMCHWSHCQKYTPLPTSLHTRAHPCDRTAMGNWQPAEGDEGHVEWPPSIHHLARSGFLVSRCGNRVPACYTV